jgi:hypothetical protein
MSTGSITSSADLTVGARSRPCSCQRVRFGTTSRRSGRRVPACDLHSLGANFGRWPVRSPRGGRAAPRGARARIHASPAGFTQDRPPSARSRRRRSGQENSAPATGTNSSRHLGLCRARPARELRRKAGIRRDRRLGCPDRELPGAPWEHRRSGHDRCNPGCTQAAVTAGSGAVENPAAAVQDGPTTVPASGRYNSDCCSLSPRHSSTTMLASSCSWSA